MLFSGPDNWRRSRTRTYSLRQRTQLVNRTDYQPREGTERYVYSETQSEFDWQESYGAVTVSRTHDEIEKDYIARQKEIHKTIAYKDEFRKFLEDNGIEYDEDGLWE